MTAKTLIIRNGTIVDGSGNEPFIGDIKIVGGLIKEVGTITGSADEEIDARGLLVTPGLWISTRITMVR